MDFWNYNEKFRKDDYTYSDIVGDLIVFEKMKERKKEGMVFILDYTEDFKKIKNCDKKDYDKSTIYWDLIYNGCIINGVDRRNFYQCHFLIKKVETIKFSC